MNEPNDNERWWTAWGFRPMFATNDNVAWGFRPMFERYINVVTKRWVVGVWVFGVMLSITSHARAQSSLQVVQTWVLPQEVALGQPFLYRVRVRLQPGHTLTLPPRTHLGVAKLLAPSVVTRSTAGPNILQIDMKLAVYQVRTFGPQLLPALWVRVVGSNGVARERALPKIKVEVIARYSSTKLFRLQEDPQVVVSPALRQMKRPPSHEWRQMGQLEALRGQKKPWDPLLLVAAAFCGLAVVLFGLGMWFRRKRRMDGEDNALPPYQVAVLQLRQLKPPSTASAEAFQLYYRQGEQILRVYLQNRLSCQLLHLTGREIPDTLHQNVMIRLSDDWWKKLGHLLQESEAFCYHPHPPGPFGHNLAAQIRALIEPVEAQMTAQEQQEESLA